MNFENFNDECYSRAIEKIKNDQKNRIICCVIPTGPTGATGGITGPTGPTGPTERLFKSSNRIIIDSS